MTFRSRLTLLELAQVFSATPRGLLSQQATRVLEFDAHSATEYAKTLRTYLELFPRFGSDGRPAVPAPEHPCATGWRRANELFGINLEQSGRHPDPVAQFASGRIRLARIHVRAATLRPRTLPIQTFEHGWTESTEVQAGLHRDDNFRAAGD